MGCRHNYVYSQGYFFCTKCGRKSDFKNRRGKKIVGVVAAVVLIGVIFVYFADFEQIMYSGDVEGLILQIERTAAEINVPDIDVPDIDVPDIDVPDIDVPNLKSPVRLESGFNSSVIEDHIYELTNSEREKRGLPMLVRVSTIDSIARSHSQDMSERNYFAHDTPEGLDPTARGAKAGYDCRKDYGSYYSYGLAENISQSYTYSSYVTPGLTSSYAWMADEAAVAKEIVDGWMASQGHRENILDGSYDRIGVGVAINSDEEIYSTQNFC